MSSIPSTPLLESNNNNNNTINSIHEKKSILKEKLKTCTICTFWIIFWILVFIGWIAIVVQFGIMRASPVNPENPQDYRNNIYIGSTYTIEKGYPPLMIHVIGGILCLLIGIIQFQDRIRKRVLIVHKIGGYIFSILLFIGFIGGVWLIPYSAGGFNTKIVFSLLSFLWFSTLCIALFYICFAERNPFVKNIPKHERIQKHREWMIRCFSCVCTAITLRIYLTIFSGLYMATYSTLTLNDAMKQVYGASAWLAVVTNLIILILLMEKEIINKRSN